MSRFGRARFALRAIAITLVIVLLGGSGALATPSTSSSSSASSATQATSSASVAGKQSELQAFEDQLDQLDVEFEQATEDFNAAKSNLASTEHQLEVTEQDLTNARLAYDVQAQLLRDRATEVYRLGNYSNVEILLESKSVSDFVSRMKFIATISGKDADVAAQLAAQKDQIEAVAEQLRNAKTQAESQAFALKAKRIELKLRIADRQKMLAGAKKELLAMMQAEAASGQADQNALLQQILAGTGNTGVVVQAGSPVETALAYHGVPYLWGGATPAAFDCSGLVQYVFAQHGVTLPHYSRAQAQLGTAVDPASLQPGDVVFFGAPIHHVGIYLGGGYYIHAPKTGDFVKISRLADRNDYAGARRYAWVKRTAPIAGLDLIPSTVDHSRGVQIQSLDR